MSQSLFVLLRLLEKNFYLVAYEKVVYSTLFTCTFYQYDSIVIGRFKIEKSKHMILKHTNQCWIRHWKEYPKRRKAM